MASFLTGVPVAYGIKPHEDSTTQLHPLGTLGFTNDGRIYRYAQAASTALDPGKLTVAADIETNHEDRDVNTFAIGDTVITVSLGGTAVTANEYDEGFLNITDATGQGIAYSIKAHQVSSAGSEDITVTLNDPIVIAAEAATTATLVRNKYRDIVVSDTTQTDLPTGVPNVTIASDAFGWVQTGGLCSILVDSNDTEVGTPVTIGAGTNGGVEGLDAIAEPAVGVQPAGVGADVGEYGVFELTLD
ncbi:hypothetical protein LCGC14_0540440 [marine sediment metagenome]|uniref:Uncharacterized protein n=1 Tax=marine sediment metagenome TaxID=412755 RepID=A0A0F9UEB4_9ZZZZ